MSGIECMNLPKKPEKAEEQQGFAGKVWLTEDARKSCLVNLGRHITLEQDAEGEKIQN